jgi:ribonuclease HI
MDSAIQILFNHAVWRARTFLEDRGKIGDITEWILSDVVDRMVRAAPQTLTDTTFPGNSFSDKLKRTAKKSNTGFGAAGSRSPEQTAAARAATGSLLNSFAKTDVIMWTDGSSLGNPGPAGSGSRCEYPDGVVEDISCFLGVNTNNAGELWAVGAGLELLARHSARRKISKEHVIRVLTDSGLVVGIFNKRWNPGQHAPLVKAIRDRMKNNCLSVKFHKVPAHAGVKGNERADWLAKAGAEFSRSSLTPALDLAAALKENDFLSLRI